MKILPHLLNMIVAENNAKRGRPPKFKHLELKFYLVFFDTDFCSSFFISVLIYTIHSFKGGHKSTVTIIVSQLDNPLVSFDSDMHNRIISSQSIQF